MLKSLSVYLAAAAACLMAMPVMAYAAPPDVYARPDALGGVHGLAAGSAYAERARITVGGTQTVSGPIALVGTGCTSVTGKNQAGAASLHVAGAVQTGVAQDTTSVVHLQSSISETSTSTIHNLKLLGGLIAAREVYARATSQGTRTSLSSTTKRSVFSGLSVAGRSVAMVKANTRVTLLGLGYVILDESTIGHGPGMTSASVNMIHVYVTAANKALGVSAGDSIILGAARSEFTRTSVNGKLGAFADGFQALGTVGRQTSFRSGPIAGAWLSCTGGFSSNRVVSFSGKGLGSVGAMRSWTYGSLRTSRSRASGESTIATLNLLGGLLHARAIHAHAWVVVKGSKHSTGSTVTFGRLAIAGHTIAQVAPNTRINLAGLGYAVINERHVSTSASRYRIAVNAVDVHVVQNNRLGLPVGIRLVLAHAEAAISRTG